MLVEGPPACRLYLHRVQQRPQRLSKGRRENFRGQVSNVGWDLLSCQELGHLVAECVAVVIEQVVAGPTEHGLS